MRTITIGRGDGANIIIDNEMISRRHAILKISTFGKIEIVDMGKNGTFVNGIRLRSNVPFPVTRKDVVRFADQDSPFTLDWSLVPDDSKKYKIAIAAIAGLLVIILMAVLIRSCSSNGEKAPAAPSRYEAAPAVEPAYSSSGASTTGSEKKENTAGENRQKDKEDASAKDKEDTSAKDKEDAKGKEDIEGKTIQKLFPQRQVKKEASPNTKKDGREQTKQPVRPSNVKTQKNGKNGKSGEKGSDNNHTVIM